MKPITTILGAAILVALVPGNRASADALSDYLGPRELAVGGAMRAEAQGALSITLNPAGLALTRELVFEGTYGHRFGTSANVFTVSGCDSTVPIAGCFYYRYFGGAADGALPVDEDRHRVHEGGATLARALGDWIFLGAGVKYVDHECEGTCELLSPDSDTGGFAVDAGAIIQPIEILRLAAVGYNLVGGASAPLYPRAFGAGVASRPFPSLGLAFDAVWNLDAEDDRTTARYGGGAEYFFTTSGGQTGYPIRLGALYDTAQESTYLTAGVGIVSAKLGLDVAASKQIGGDALMLQASLRIFGPRQVGGTSRYR